MPPDLSEAERPLAVFPPESSRETTCDNPPPRLAAECITSSIGTGVPREEHHPLPRPAAESADSNTGKGGGGQVHQPQGCGGGSKVGEGASGFTNQGGETQVTSSNVPLYRLSPALRATFTSVGATDKPYPFREVLQTVSGSLILGTVVCTRNRHMKMKILHVNVVFLHLLCSFYLSFF